MTNTELDRGDAGGRRPRVGWVFEGGGAKGSFSFAAARSLMDAGVPVDCTSGTSVGALTALLIACGATADGARLWETLGRKDVLPFRGWRIFSIPYLIVLIFLHGYMWMFKGRRAWPDAGPMRRWIERIAFGFIFLPGFAVALEMWNEGSWGARVFAAFQALFILFAIIVHTGDDWPEDERRTLLGFAHMFMSFYLLAVPTGFVLIVASSLFGSGSITHHILQSPTTYALLISLLMHFLASTSKGRSALTSVPLRNKIKTILDIYKPHIPLYVTVAYEHTHYDPDFTSIAARQAHAATTIQRFPVTRTEFIQKYLRVDNLDADVIADLATASAALPLGLLKPARVNGVDVVDGGVADNVPIRPLIDQYECDVLFVFRLNADVMPRIDDLISQHPDMVQHWKRTWRKEDLTTYQLPENFHDWDWSRFENPKSPTFLPWRPVPKFWPEIIYVGPDPRDPPLGGDHQQPLGGLLDFSKETRLARETRGRAAADRALIQWNDFVETWRDPRN